LHIKSNCKKTWRSKIGFVYLQRKYKNIYAMKIKNSKTNQQARRLGKIVKIENSSKLNNSLDMFRLRNIDIMENKDINPYNKIFVK
jgi:hypothetical protein